MKRSKSLIVLLLLLVLAVAFYLVATVIAKREEEDAPEETVENTVTLVDTTVGKVTSFSYRSSEREIGIVSADGKYSYSQDPDFPLDQIVASDILSGVADITFVRKLEGDDLDPAEYGLDDPDIVIEAAYSDDNPAVTLKLGDYNKHADVYYCDIGDGAVYLLEASFLEPFDVSFEDMLQDEYIKETPDDMDCVTKIEVVFRDGSGFTYTPAEVVIPADTAETDGTASGAETETESIWIKTLLDGTVIEGDFTEKVETLYDQMFEVELEDWAGYNVTGAEKLGVYGLADPAVTVTIRYEDTVIIAGDDNTANVTQTLEKVMGFLIGDAVLAEDSAGGDDTAETAETAETSEAGETEEITQTEEAAESAETAETSETEETAETAEADGSDPSEEKTEPRRYFMLEGGKVVYLIDEADLSGALS